jgi:GWxTD domain-containing protein
MNFKTFLPAFALSALLPFSAFSGEQKNLKAVLAYKSFYSAQTGPYIETYLSVAGQSVMFAENAAGKYQAAIEVKLFFRQGDEIKYADKYTLLSPETEDPDKVNFNFLDQKRVPLANGSYRMELSVRDVNREGARPFTSERNLIVDYHPNTVAVSDIELVESYTPIQDGQATATTKNGYDIIPYVNNYYPPGMNTLKFYAEIYNTPAVLGAEPFLVSYHIETFEKKRVLEQYRGFSKREPTAVSVVLGEFPIENLPSGNYSLVVEARNRQNEIIAYKDCFFQRNNGQTAAEMQEGTIRDLQVENTFVAAYTDKDTLAEFISSLQPVSNATETMFEHNQLKIADVKLMQQFFYDFWSRRNPEDPESAWQAYRLEVTKVNKEFGTLSKRGYETDRGRVYLQYGPPDRMIREYNEPSAYPYEIWHYHTMENQGQTNRKFVFYNPDLVTNDFALIHSTATGEIQDNQWQLRLHKRDLQTNDLDRNYQINSQGAFGNKVNAEWQNH